MANFLRRNPVLKTKKQYRIDSVRVNGATTEIIKPWFQKLEVPAIKVIKPENRWNMDEAGIMEGQGENGLVVGSAQKRFIQKKQPGGRTWTSFIECISALGHTLLPLVIYKGKSVQQQWFGLELKDYKGWKFHATDNGWTTDATALEWLLTVFIPQSAPRDPKDHRLLILDGHGSHETTEFMWECFKHNIHLLFLPAYTSHVLQPLDLSIFSPLKRAYRYYLGLLALMNDSTPIGKRNFLECYKKARIDAITPTNIKAGWSASGLWPVRMSKPLMNRLLLENSNKLDEQTLGTSRNVQALEWHDSQSAAEFQTPQKGEDVRRQVSQITGLQTIDSSTTRVLFRKISKGIEQKDFVIAQQEMKIKQLESRLVQLQPRKRRKVQASPNSKFVSIEDIMRAQIEVGERQNVPLDSEGTTTLASTLSHITIEE
jgi:4-hydroxybenzoate polyprenyltransferase